MSTCLRSFSRKTLRKEYVRHLYKNGCVYFLSMVKRPLGAQDLLIIEVSLAYTQHSVGILWMRNQPDEETLALQYANWQGTGFHYPGGIRTPNSRKQAVADPPLWRRGHWDRYGRVIWVDILGNGRVLIDLSSAGKPRGWFLWTRQKTPRVSVKERDFLDHLTFYTFLIALLLAGHCESLPYWEGKIIILWCRVLQW
jgi:hypothetical protein